MVLEEGWELCGIGAQVVDYTESFTKKTATWAKQITELFDLNVCGIDIFSETGLDDPENFTLIEVNSNPHVAGIFEAGHEEKVWKILRTVLDDYFND